MVSRHTLIRLLIGCLLCSALLGQPTFTQAAELTRFAARQDVGETGNIHGLLWIDLNRNGSHEDVEPRLAAQAVYVTPDSESDFAQVLVLATDTQGEFSATNLTPGRYRVWAPPLTQETAVTVNVTTDRAVMIVQLPLTGYQLFMPQITR